MSTNTLREVGSDVLSDPKLDSYMKQIRKLEEELKTFFPEREELITQLVYGLLTREHVLVYGETGTGKSFLAQCFFSAFTGGEQFAIQLDKFTKNNQIFGVPDYKKLREESKLWYNREGTILDAHFVELDELFDASDFLLRSLLRILHERQFMQGAQREEVPLHMALASTNAEPDRQVQRSTGLGAVVDRFLFQTKISYLEEDESRRSMYNSYLQRGRPSVKIPYQSIDIISKAVCDVPFNDPRLIELYNQIVERFEEKAERESSDRRKCQGLKLAQANAVLFGRREVAPEDLLAVRWAFCYGHDADAHTMFKEVADPLIEEMVKNSQPNVIQSQMGLLDALSERIPEITDDEANTIPSDKLVEMRRSLVQLQADVQEITPAHESVTDKRKSVLQALEVANRKVGRLIDGVNPE